MNSHSCPGDPERSPIKLERIAADPETSQTKPEPVPRNRRSRPTQSWRRSIERERSGTDRETGPRDLKSSPHKTRWPNTKSQTINSKPRPMPTNHERQSIQPEPAWMNSAAQENRVRDKDNQPVTPPANLQRLNIHFASSKTESEQ